MPRADQLEFGVLDRFRRQETTSATTNPDAAITAKMIPCVKAEDRW
jgi:hypothetical protein